MRPVYMIASACVTPSILKQEPSQRLKYKRETSGLLVALRQHLCMVDISVRAETPTASDSA